MNAEKLSKRLKRVSKYIISKGTLADIGSDHAYLPCYAIENNLVSKAIAGEVVEGPFKSAKLNVAERDLTSQIDVRFGSGLSVLLYGEANNITICGMGGTLIAQILEEGKEKLSGKERLILQPNINAEIIREWLENNQWALIAEDILEEDGKIYEILVAEKGIMDKLNEAELLMGPLLMIDRSITFIKKWSCEKEHYQKILNQIETAQQTEKNDEKKSEVIHKITLIQNVINK
ncbi:MAG: tRNA ((1))-methyltransferase [Bacillales bacterium]|jgi:tRNA (adenine22-N1)-methyltransferase|nr:tRNA ((1))-methyltransferase [Bacillales bacterium]